MVSSKSLTAASNSPRLRAATNASARASGVAGSAASVRSRRVVVMGDPRGETVNEGRRTGRVRAPLRVVHSLREWAGRRPLAERVDYPQRVTDSYESSGR